MQVKATGIVRRIDDLGRIVIPREIRETNGINAGDPFEIFVGKGYIGLRKYVPEDQCIICHRSEEKMFHTTEGNICETCAKTIIAACGGKVADR